MARSRSKDKTETKPAKEAVTLGIRSAAEGFGTFVLVAGGVGTAVFASAFPDSGNALGVGFLGVALAFGLALMAAIAAVGHLSGGHFNPAVSVGLAIAGRIAWKDVPAYIGAQLVGGLAGAGVVALIAADGPSGYFGAARDAGFASNGYGDHSPGGFGLLSVIVAEVVLTAVFVGVILAVTANKHYRAVAPLLIGLTLTVVHLISIPVSNTSVNPPAPSLPPCSPDRTHSDSSGSSSSPRSRERPWRAPQLCSSRGGRRGPGPRRHRRGRIATVGSSPRSTGAAPMASTVHEAGDGVHIVASDGVEILFVPVREVVVNVCFGGPDGTDLFITATTSLYRLRTRTRAAEAQRR